MSENVKKKRRSWPVRILKFVGWVVASIILLLVAIALLIQLPPIQTKLTRKAISFLEEKIGTDVSLERISISFPKAIVIEGLYFEDQNKDTLLYVGEFSVDTDLWALTRREIQLNELSLKDTKANIFRPENDSAYNFSYILKAFAGDSTATPDTLEQKGWKFSLEEIQFENVNARYHDYLTGNLADLALGSFEVSISEFNLDSMKIMVDDIRLADTRANVVQTKQPEVTEEVAEEKQPLTYDVGVAEVTLENIYINFHQKALGQQLKLDLAESILKTDKIDLKKARIDLSEFVLRNTFVSYQKTPVTLKSQKSQTDPEPVSEKRAEDAQVWVISLNKVDMSGNSIQFFDETKSHERNTFDFDHIWLKDFNVEAKQIVLAGSEIKCDLQNLTFTDHSGFQVREFRTQLDLRNKGVDINKLFLQTGNSRFEIDAKVTYPSLANIGNELSKLRFNANINNTSIGIRDLLYFNPALKDSLPVDLKTNSKIKIDAVARGSVADINIGHLDLSAFDNTVLKTRGRITGLPDTKQLRLDITLDKLYTTHQDIKAILPDTTLASINFPGWLNLAGTYKGSLTQSAFNTQFTSDAGNIDLAGKINIDSLSTTRGYDLNVKVADLDLGHILDKQDTIGKLNMVAAVNAHGLTPKEMNGAFNATISSFEYRKYTYKNFRIDGKIINSLWSGIASMKDRNLEFAIAGDLDYRTDIPKYNITFDVKNADFKALNLAQRELKARGILVANLATPDFKVINGTFGVRKVAIHNGDDLYAVDSLLFASLDQTGHSELKIDSDLLSGRFEGSFNIFKMPDAIREYVSTYYNLQDTTTAKKPDPGRQYFNFDVKLKKTELLTDVLLPQLKEFKPKEFKGQFDSEAKILDIDLVIDRIQYNTIGVNSFTLRTRSDTEELKYIIEADEILIDSMKVDGLELKGLIADNMVNTDLVILDSANNEKYFLGAIFKSLDKGFQFSLRPEAVRLNYVDWTVTPDNYIRFGGPKIIANNIKLVNGREQIIIDSRDDEAQTLFVGFRELNLEYLVSMINREKPVSGLLHGDIFIVPDTANMTFTADLGIKDFNISEIPWGDVHFAVDRKTRERFDVGFGIKSNRNDVHAEGYYITGQQPRIDLTAIIQKFDLRTVEPVTAGQLKDLKGGLTGRIHVAGATSKPQIRGALTVKDVAFFSNYVMSAFSIQRETITLDDVGISFNTFEILDANKNKAVIDGTIETTDYSKFAFNLNVEADRFRLLNTTEKDNELFYGLVDMDAKAKIGGTLLQPAVDVTLGLSDDSHLTYVVPQTDAGVMDQEGIVRFVDRTFENDKFMKMVAREDTVKSQFTGIDLTARIDLTDQEKFTVVIDPTTGDQLTVRGNTTLTLEMDPSGDMNLSGRYEISEGTYNLSFYKFVKREFQIQKGSTMTWSGDPMNAAMDMTAMYEVETAPVDLLSNQLEPADVNRYKQRLPFQVFLNITGQLLTPEISFKLDMPLEERNYGGGLVYSTLQDINTRESDLNKQVFALLILKRFISENPFENQGAQGFEGSARSSVSKMLTEQLNRLSQNVRGVELSFDVKSYEDYSSGQAQGQTELQLGLSKTLFNDRLVVKVAGNVGVEGQSNQEVTDYIGDLALEYKLTEDGRFRIIGFRNSNYDMIDGQLTETGTGLIFIKDYELLSELFKANANNKKK